MTLQEALAVACAELIKRGRQRAERMGWKKCPYCRAPADYVKANRGRCCADRAADEVLGPAKLRQERSVN